MTELETLTEATEAAAKAYRDRNSEVEREARDAAYAAERKVKSARADELKALRQVWHEADAARVAHLDSTVRHPLEGRRVIRQWKSGPSWSPKMMTERGVIRVRRAETRLPNELKSWARPAIGEAYIQHIRADGSEGTKVTKLFNKMQTEAEWSEKPPYDGIKGHWNLDDSAEAQSTLS